jgi:amidohydrolase
MPVSLRDAVRSVLPSVTIIRRDLHAHPELAYQERRTSGVVCAELNHLGVAHIGGLAGGTGVLAHIPATTPEGNARGAVALRADMDALPIVENTGVPYTSKTPGVMHACGHDGHTANLLGVAGVLMKLAHRPNPVTLIFQPAEEGGAGGKRMCEDGALDGSRLGPRVDRIFGLHGWPQYVLGDVGSRAGPLLAATDNFEVEIVGTQSHAAYPHLSRDAVVTTAQIITALQSIASRNAAPTECIVVTVAVVNGGVARNVIPRSVHFAGTMRTLTPEMRALGRERFHAITSGIAGAMGCEARIRWEEGYPVTFNDPAMTERFFRVARRTIGETRVREVPTPTMGGEDFSYYGHHVPACFFILGVRPPGQDIWPSLHQPEYDFNDDALETGIELMCELALDES